MNTNLLRQAVILSLLQAAFMTFACFVGTPLLGALLQLFVGYALTIVLPRSPNPNLPVIHLTTLIPMSTAGGFVMASTSPILNIRIINLPWIMFGGVLLFWLPFIVSTIKRDMRREEN